MKVVINRIRKITLKAKAAVYEYFNQQILIAGGRTGFDLGHTKKIVRENNRVIICGKRASSLKVIR